MMVRFLGWQAVLDQRERTAERKRRWEQLKQLAADDLVPAFFQHYAEYLEWDELVSPSRKALQKMVLSAANQLRGTTKV